MDTASKRLANLSAKGEPSGTGHPSPTGLGKPEYLSASPKWSSLDHFVHCSACELLNDNPKWVKSFRSTEDDPDAYIGHPVNSQEGQKAKQTVMLNHIPFLMLATVDSGAFNLGTQQPLAPYLLNSIRRMLIGDVRSASKQLFSYVEKTGNSDFQKFFDRPRAVEDLATKHNVAD